MVGSLLIPGLPFRCGAIDTAPRAAAPMLGEHNAEILQGWLGLSNADLHALEADHIIGKRPVGL